MAAVDEVAPRNAFCLLVVEGPRHRIDICLVHQVRGELHVAVRAELCDETGESVYALAFGLCHLELIVQKHFSILLHRLVLYGSLDIVVFVVRIFKFCTCYGFASDSHKYGVFVTLLSENHHVKANDEGKARKKSFHVMCERDVLL